MNDAIKRDEWDQHNRDEAKERAAQQETAGPTHAPVRTEPYANLAGTHAAAGADVDVAVLIEAYERATESERRAWLAARELVAQDGRVGAWNAWRDAVERTQQAARCLVDHGAGRPESR